MPMTDQIPHDQWPAFLAELSRRDRGIHATVEVFGDDIGAQTAAFNLPLVGITDDVKAGGGERITIILARPDEGDYSHSIVEPKDVSLERDDAGGDRALRIGSADGTQTLVRFGASGGAGTDLRNLPG